MCADARALGGPAGQRGALLLEFMVAALLGVLLLVWAGQEWAQRMRALQAQSLAAWMAPARDAALALLRQHGALIRQADTAAALADQGIADWQAPRWTELKALGLLAGGWQESGPLNQRLDLRIDRIGACPEAPCRLQAFVAARAGLRDARGQVDEYLISEWLQAARGEGWIVWPQAPGQLRGAGQLAVVPPTLDWAPGTVALRAQAVPAPPAGAAGDEAVEDGDPAADPLDHTDFLRLRDLRDPDFQGAATVQGWVRSGAWLQGREGLVLVKGVSSGASCAVEGGMGRSGGRLGLLVCQGGRWRPLAGPSGGGYLFSTRWGCANRQGSFTGNPVTGGCLCETGYQAVQVSESGDAAHVDGVSRGYLCIPG
ncbi:hypothetical protein ACMHYJ_06535 [Castellaniella hirudinis]|uniref:hypothetical protein n=1 Tax=Castellaniella hirudinis TaxID=1144617 RepID=UPI0039C3D0ED